MFDLYKHPYRDALLRWYRAYRLVAGETEALSITPNAGALRVALCLPVREETTYQELQSLWLYRLINTFEEVQLERVVALSPAYAQELTQQGETLRSMESASPLGDFDILLVLLDQPEDLLNMLRIFAQAGLPVHAKDRSLNTNTPQPKVYGVGRLGQQSSVLVPWLDDFLKGDPLASLLSQLPRWKAQKKEGLPFQVESQQVYHPIMSWPTELLLPAIEALSSKDRDVLWALGQWHIQGCPFCRDALLQETKSTVLSRLLQGLIDMLQPSPQTPAWERWELWLQQAHQDHQLAQTLSFGGSPPKQRRTRSVFQRQQEALALATKDEKRVAGPVSQAPEAPPPPLEDAEEVENIDTSEACEQHLAQRKEAVRALYLDTWLDRMLYRQDEWALCMAMADYPRALGASQQEAEDAWYQDDLGSLSWMWRRRLSQRQTRIPIDIALGSYQEEHQEALAWARLAREATKISQLYQRGSRVKLFAHPRLPLPQTQAALSPTPSHDAWKNELATLEHFAHLWDFRVKTAPAWRRTFSALFWRGTKAFSSLTEALYKENIDLLEEEQQAESCWQTLSQSWCEEHGLSLDVSLSPSEDQAKSTEERKAGTTQRCQVCCEPTETMHQFLHVLEENTEDFLQTSLLQKNKLLEISIPSNPNQHRCRLHYARTGYATLMTQKDFLPLLHANLRRSGLPFMREGGDTVTARFASDLPLGVSSVAEYVDVSFVCMPDLEDALARLQRYAMQGLSFLAIAPLHARLLGISKVVSAWRYFCPLPPDLPPQKVQETIEKRFGVPCSFSRKEETYQADLRKLVPSWELLEGASSLPPSWAAWQGIGLSLILQDSQGKTPRPLEIFSHLLEAPLSAWQLVRLKSGRFQEGKLLSPLHDTEEIISAKKKHSFDI